jgi:hypothetical protein
MADLLRIFYAALFLALVTVHFNAEAYPRGSCADRIALVAIIMAAKNDGFSKAEYLRYLDHVFERGDFEASLTEREEIRHYVDLVFDGTAALNLMVQCGGPKVSS